MGAPVRCATVGAYRDTCCSRVIGDVLANILQINDLVTWPRACSEARQATLEAFVLSTSIPQRHRVAGFTLLELIIVFVVLGIMLLRMT